jgi:hypothetical protein
MYSLLLIVEKLPTVEEIYSKVNNLSTQVLTFLLTLMYIIWCQAVMLCDNKIPPNPRERSPRAVIAEGNEAVPSNRVAEDTQVNGVKELRKRSPPDMRR